jgi:hypothetical protein
MIRTVWVAIVCLIGLAALTVIKVGTTSFEAALPFDQTTGSNLNSDASSSDQLAPGTLAKGDRLDIADEDDAVKPVRPIAITTKVAATAASETSGSETSSSEKGWRSSYAKRQASGPRHRKGKLHKTSRHHRSYHVSRSHAKSKHALTRKKKSRR